MSKKLNIIVGMSGGVDSSVAAYLLHQAGHHVTGVFMQNWEEDEDDSYCSASQDLSDAKSVCDVIGIPLKTVNFAKNYWDRVFQHFLDEYSAGRTPNPDILCNQEIKFKAFLNYALDAGADAIATGHYAINQLIEGEYQLCKGRDCSKDQSYFLYTLGQHQLKHALFPLGNYEKSAIREIASESGFLTHNKKDSTGICFIGERKFKQFLSEYILAKPGKMLTQDGVEIGQHQGLMFYTLGQRQGLNIGGRKDFPEKPWYVLEKKLSTNVLIVGQNSTDPLLMGKHLTCQQLKWVAKNPPCLPLTCQAKIRYRQADQACTVTQQDAETLSVTFNEPQRAITPGQSIVFYQNEQCLGGGVIQ